RRSRPPEGGWLHRLLRHLHGDQPAADQRNRRFGRRIAPHPFWRAAAPDGRCREIAMDPARLLQLRRTRLQPRVSGFLRARAPLGNRRPLRILRGALDALVAATLAPACVACKKPLDSPSLGCVCRLCWGVVAISRPEPWTSAHISYGISAGRYEGA